jgi:hypothetical protein
MAKLIYTAISSLDGYRSRTTKATSSGAPADEEVHRFINDLERPIGTYLFGRRLYEVMRVLGNRANRRRRAVSEAGLCAGSGRLPTRFTTHNPEEPGCRKDEDRAGVRNLKAIEQMKAAAALDITRWWPNPRGPGFETRTGRTSVTSSFAL